MNSCLPTHSTEILERQSKRSNEKAGTFSGSRTNPIIKLEKVLQARREARTAKHLLVSFLDPLGLLVVHVHPSAADPPAAQVGVVPRVCDGAVHSKGGA